MSARNLKVIILLLFAVLTCKASWGWDWQECHYSCDQCWWGINDYHCSSCPWYRVADNYAWAYYTCTCPYGTYDPGYSACPACSYQCSSCVSSASNCLTCNGNYRGGAPNCACNNGYFDVGSPNCQACNYKCATCVSSSANCQSCNGNYRGSTPSCSCITGYYDVGSPNCQPCLYSCLTCAGTSTTCSSCSSSSQRALVSSSCPCIGGYYEQSNRLCQPCNYKCATCVSSSTNCLTCPSGSNRGATPACSCLIKFYDNATPTCQACHYSCKQCTSSTKCDSCNSGLMRLFTGTSTFCVCPDRYYDPGSEGCVACHATCFRCNGAGSSNCISCISSAFRVLSGTTCACMTGYYSTATTVQQCSACTYSCLTCSSSASNCLTCSATLNRVLTSAKCPCKPTYFQNSTLLCDTCHTSCATCTGKLACTTCISSQLTTIDSTGFCSCAAGTFWATATSKCTACNYKCSTCSVSATNCTSCPANSFRVYGINTCNCIVGYYDPGAVACLPCHYTCKTCTGGTSSACATCDTATNRIFTTNSCPCKGKYYDNGSSAQCLPCSYRCLTCSAANTCLTCDSSLNRVFVSSNSSCQCPSTYYQSNFQCFACKSTCLTCSNGQTCITCDSTLYRSLNTTTNLCDCQTGYYLTTGGTCSACSSLCITCNAANTCLTCKPNLNRTLNTATSTCDCDTGYIIITSSNVCNSCQYSCLTCQTSFTTKCATCLTSTKRTLNSGNSQCECPIGYYDDGSNPSCVACSYTCLTCDTNPKKCLSCPAGSNRVYDSVANTCYCAQHFYDNNVTFTQSATCLACQYHCSTCLSSSSCTSCNAANFRTFDAGNTQCICMVGYYNDGVKEKCAACSYKCQTCTNSTACLSCNSTWKRDTPATQCPCTTGYYDNGVSICKACDYSCLTCTTGTKCVTCQGLYNRVLNSTTKLCSCAAGYYDPGVAQCQPCSYTCLTCITSGSKCLTCKTTALRTFQSSSNTCPCNNGFYDNSSITCAPCNYTCSTCGNNRSCLTCNITKFRSMNKLTGLCGCITSYYDNNSTQTCLPCESTCLTCINSTNCTTCDANRNRVINHTGDYSNTFNYFCPCLYKYYDLGSTDICSPCHFSCSYCSAQKINNCLYCSADAQRTLQPSKKCTCNDGYYDTNATQTCPKCNIGCITCWDNLTTTCFTCNTTNFMMEGKNTCYEDCPIYYFNNVTMMVCQLCQAHCIECVDSTNCSECEAPMFLYLQKCEATCPPTFYPNSTTHRCQMCKSGCANCTRGDNCFKCVDTSYYVDKATTLCQLCSIQCLTCFGPQANNCQTCTYPLYLNDQYTCVEISCSYGRYVDSIKGCVKCSKTFPNSLSCNKTEAFLCESPYLLDKGKCVSCEEVAGYKLSRYGECIQICGDGLLIYYQCDDGNNLNGDGCSANCLIEQGWKCIVDSGKSKCSLSSAVSLDLSGVIKYGRENRIKINLKISLPIRLNNDNFQLSFIDLDTVYYSYSVAKQSERRLNEVSIQVTYKTDIQNKSIQLAYTSSRRLLQQSSPSRSLAAITFTSTFNIVAFPPANFITTPIFDFYDIVEKIIYGVSIALVIFNFVIVPKKYGLHSVTFSWIVPYIFITLFAATPYLTQWISPICSGLRNPSVYFGFTLGSCCLQDEIKDTTTEVMGNNAIIFMLLGSIWIVFLVLKVINICFQACQKALQLAKYYLITLHLLFFCQIAYSSANALYNYQLTNLIDSINTSLALFIQFCIVFYVAALWYITHISNFQGRQDENSSKAATRQTVSKQSNETEHNDSNVIINLGIIKEISRYDYPENTNPTMLASSTNFIKDTRNSSEGFKEKQKSSEQISIQQVIEQDENFLKFDYCYSYRNISTKSKYFLPMLMLKLFGYFISAATMQQYPFYMLCLHCLLSLGMLVFILAVKPFTSKFTHVRLVITELQVIALQSIFAAYLFFASKLIYLNNIQYYIVSAILLLLVSSFVFVLIEQAKIWKSLLADLCSSCFLYIGLRGRKTQVDIHPQPAEQPRVMAVEAVSQGQIGQVDAFYARVLQKNALNRKYKKERMIHDADLQKNFS